MDKYYTFRSCRKRVCLACRIYKTVVADEASWLHHMHYVKEFGFSHEDSALSLDIFKQGSDIIRSSLRTITFGNAGDVLEGAQ